MLVVKRLFTAFAFTGVLFVLLFAGSLLVACMVMQATTSTERQVTGGHLRSVSEPEWGRSFGDKYGAIFLGGSAVLAVVLACGMSFSGILPWCRPPEIPRPKALPPPLPEPRGF